MKSKVYRILLYTGLALLALLCVLPFLLMIINATRSGKEIMTSFSLLPGTSIGDNWKVVTEYFNLPRGFLNSLLVALPATFLSGYFSAMTAYALAIYKFKGSRTLFTVIVVFMMIPSQLGLLGFYNLVSRLGLVDSYIPLIVPAIAVPGVVFFLRQYVLSVLPKALLESARIDGASEIAIFHQIVLPIMMPGIATMSIGTFIANWNSYLIPMILINSPEKFTLPVMIASLNSSTDIMANQGAIYLAVAISVVPVLVIFAFFSRYIISSISSGAVKG